MKTIVSKEWLRANIVQPQVKILDCSWYMPSLNHPVEADFIANRIKGSVRFDIDQVADKSTNLPHMVPSLKQFEDQVSKLGISPDSIVVCYDTTSQFMASARVWWMFKLFGHKDVYVLDKGFSKELFKNDLDLVESGPVNTQPKKEHYISFQFRRDLLVTLNQILSHANLNIVDARSADRFYAKISEPRPGLVGGHIPGSFNVPFGTAIRDGSFIDETELKRVFSNSGLDLNKPIITSCGSGVTAAVLSLALDSIGLSSAVYDGSWAEYGMESLGNKVSTE